MNRLLFYITLFACFTGAQLYAQDLEVAPVRINFNVVPGESQSRTVTVKNHSNRTETITLRLQDFLVPRQGGLELLAPGSTRNSIATWVNLNPTFLVLQPNESQTVQVNLQSPADDFTAKWGILSFSTATEQTAFTADRDVQAGVAISGRIDIYLYYNPQTGDVGNVEINNLQETYARTTGQRQFTVNLDNLGERITACKVFLIASNMQTGEEYNFRPVEVTTYPQSARTVELTLPETLPPGRYALAAILDYPGSASLKGTQIMIQVD